MISVRLKDVHGGTLALSHDATKRLALALGPVRAVIRVVDRSSKPMNVEWSQVGQDERGISRSLSYTDFSGGRIAVNPLPVLEQHHKALEVVTGFGLHEASHCQEGTKDRFAVLLERKSVATGVRRVDHEVPVFRPLRLAVYLLNLADDVRVEAATSAKWPGFAPYFLTVLDYLWKDPEAITGDAPRVAAQLRLAWYAIRYGERAHTVRAGLTENLTGDGRGVLLDYDAEYAFWTGWNDDYLAGRVDTRETVRRGMEHLALDPASKSEMTKMEAAEVREERAGEQLRAQIERLMREGVDGVPGVCVTHDGEIRPLSEAEAQAVNQLVREGLVSARPILTAEGDQEPEITITKPTETPESKRAYIGSPTSLVEAMRAALVFRSAAPQHDLKLQERGTMDDEELWRIATGDFRVFSERIIEAKSDVALGLLVDISGSMSGTKLAIAQRLAQTFVWALQDQTGVELRVWAHTASQNAEVYRIWEPGDPLSRLGLLSSLDHSSNADSYAIGYCVQQLLPLTQPQKALIVLSDGLPSFTHYGGGAARQHVRKVTDWAARQGCTVIQVAIDDVDLRPAEQAQMFGPGRWVPYTSDAALPRDLTRVLNRLT